MASLSRPSGCLASWQDHIQDNPRRAPWFQVVRDDVPRQGINTKPPRSIQPRLPSGEGDKEEYFKRHCPNFSTENTHDLSEVFWQMIMATKLLGSSIYEIKEVWAEPDELQQANYTLRTLHMGLKFLRAVSPSESPKVMGLMGIHDPDTLCHFYGVTHCPWCGKEGQSEGTVVNHLWMVDYRLGLVCKKCYGCPSTSSKTLCCQGQKDCQPSGEGGPDESSSSA